MKKVKTAVILILILIMFSGCGAEPYAGQSVLGAHGEQESEDSAVGMTDMSVLYYPDMDTNPVTTDCLANHELLKLVYSPLLRIGGNYKPVCVLAQDFEFDGQTVTVHLREGIKFSNGEVVRAGDVVKSYNAAGKEPSSPYYMSVSAMSEYYAKDEYTFVCKFKKPDVDAPSLLDVPVMYNGQPGSGCGPYVFSEQNGKSVLVINDNYFEKAQVPLIRLVDTKTDKQAESMFSAGTLDIISLTGSDDMSLSSLRNYKIVSYPSNNLLYIGVTSQNELLARADVRYAISACIDRERLASQSLVGLADASVYPFSPHWYKISARHTDNEYDSEAAKSGAARLKDIGLTLLIPSGSDIKSAVAAGLSEQFKAHGIVLEVVEKEPGEYMRLVQSGKFDLYLGESAIARDMDPTYIYSQGGLLNFTGVYDEELDGIFERYKSGHAEIGEYLDRFSRVMPIVPIAFMRGVMYCSGGIQNFSAQSPWNMYGAAATITLN